MISFFVEWIRKLTLQCLDALYQVGDSEHLNFTTIQKFEMLENCIVKIYQKVRRGIVALEGFEE